MTGITRTLIVLNVFLSLTPWHNPLAKLSVTHYNSGLDLDGPSEEVKTIWTESLLHSRNATFGIRGHF
jgi:hypothetical protein